MSTLSFPVTTNVVENVNTAFPQTAATVTFTPCPGVAVTVVDGAAQVPVIVDEWVYP